MKQNSIKKTLLNFGMVLLALMTLFTSQAQTWDYKDSGTDFILLDLSIPPGQNNVAYAAGSLYTVDSEGIIIKTIDGGETWETIYPLSGTVPSFTKIEFVTPLKGFAVGWGNTFLITEDGGATWQDVAAGNNVYYYTSLNFYNEDIGFAVALNNTSGADSYRTNDGGATWIEETNTSEMSEFAAAYADETTLFTVGKEQRISKSLDGGESWTEISQGANAMYNFRVFFRDVDNGIVSSEDGTLLTTHDSGISWDSFSTGYHNFYALNYKGNEVFAGGTDQDVFYSPDNGSTWNMIYDGPPTSTFYQIEFFADDSALICGSGGIILKVTDILGLSNNTIEGFKYYPNPTTNVINLNAKENIENVAIFNVLGQKVVNQNINAASTQIDVDHLNAGTYIMMVTVDGKTGTYKIVKE